MNAPAQIRPWNYFSHVKSCPDCEGKGVVHAHRRPHVDDPYPEDPCECGMGEHEPACDVCGYNMEVAGYDCLACDTVAALTTSELARFDADGFAKAVKLATELALADASRRAA